MAKILIVEDDPRLNAAYDIILKKNGYSVQRAKDGKEGLEKAEEFQPELILLDMIMPVMDGLEFLKRYNRNNRHPDVKIIVFSNVETAKQLDAAYKLGAERYILKSSISPKQLVELIHTTLLA